MLDSCHYWFGLGCYENEKNVAYRDAADSYYIENHVGVEGKKSFPLLINVSVPW